MMMRVCSYGAMILNITGMCCVFGQAYQFAAMAHAGASALLACQCLRQAETIAVMMKARRLE